MDLWVEICTNGVCVSVADSGNVLSILTAEREGDRTNVLELISVSVCV